ncbi:MAG: T9SS type A sorting domain-containing protein [Bacteroidia bacterium]
MKNLIKISFIFAFHLMFLNQISAKKVKLSVNMKGQTINPNGLHVSGDFQTLAGFPGGDWNSATTALTVDPNNSNIFSVIVDIPAGRKYEFKFVNGDLFYEVEFVPEESRVGYDFNDNRWFYLDSLANDTTLIGPLMFAGNAPESKKLLRLKVDLKGQTTINPKGIHVAGTFNNFDYKSAYMYKFINEIYEYQVYADSGETISYHFVNGNTEANAEELPQTCAVNGKRQILLTTDFVADTVCFSNCQYCATTGLISLSNPSNFTIFPNPALEEITINGLDEISQFQLSIYDANGQLKLDKTVSNHQSIQLKDLMLNQGVYVVKIQTGNKVLTKKLMLY